MADKTLDALTAAAALGTADLFYCMQGGNSRKATGTQIQTLCSTSDQSTSLSQISSSLSGAISSTTSLSTAVSTVDSNQSTSLSQISSSLSGAISSTTSLSTAVSTVDSNQSTSISINLSKINSLSTALGGGGQWVELLNYDFAGTPASTKECDVTGYHEILVVGDQLTYDTTSVQRCIQVSVDGGGTWFTASGDYQDISAAGVGANNAAFFGHNTATAAARNICIHIMENSGRNPVNAHIVTRSFHQIFRGSATAINRIRLMGSAAASGTPSANNFTAGTLRIYGR